jgi:hypothetical protein
MLKRSTRAAAAVARLKERSKGHRYLMTRTAAGLFFLSERTEGGDEQVSGLLPLDDFVRFVDAMGPQKVRRMTKNDIAFEKQLAKKPKE